MQLFFVLPILILLVRVAFGEWENRWPCIDGENCDHLIDCDYAHSDRGRVCALRDQQYCYIGEKNRCESIGSGNFECDYVGHAYRCAEKKLQCSSRADCSQLFECKDSYCSPTSVECYGDEECNVFSKCSDLICKTNFESGYTIAMIVGGVVAGIVLLCCIIPRLYRLIKSDQSKKIGTGARRF